ncbi:MAG: hypothetical protein U0840_29300 [Gemmataceae bacterium]
MSSNALAHQAEGDDLEPLAVDMAQLARLTSFSVRHLRRLDSSRDIPGRFGSGRSVRFRLADIKQWVHHGMPNKARWTLLERTGQLKGTN